MMERIIGTCAKILMENLQLNINGKRLVYLFFWSRNIISPPHIISLIILNFMKERGEKLSITIIMFKKD